MTVITLDGVVGWDIDAKEFADTLNSLSGDIVFDTNSGGGYITDGVSILNLIRNYDRGTTTARVSYAASMMTQIALACDKVEVYDNAIFMIHNAQGVAFGDHREQRKQADIQERMSNMLAKLYVKKSGKTLLEIQEMMDNDTYLFGEEIVESGFADSVIVTEKDKDKTASIQTSHTAYLKVEKAMKDEKLTASQMQTNFSACLSGCDLKIGLHENVSTPSASVPDSVKLEKQITGDGMEKFDKENLEASELAFNALVAKNNGFQDTIQKSATALNLKTEEVASLNEQVTALETKLSGAFAKDETLTRMQEAIEIGATAEVALQMLQANSSAESTKIGLNAQESDGGSNQHGMSKTSLWDKKFNQKGN